MEKIILYWFLNPLIRGSSWLLSYGIVAYLQSNHWVFFYPWQGVLDTSLCNSLFQQHVFYLLGFYNVVCRGSPIFVFSDSRWDMVVIVIDIDIVIDIVIVIVIDIVNHHCLNFLFIMAIDLRFSICTMILCINKTKTDCHVI
jgi:hypothetical protein